MQVTLGGEIRVRWWLPGTTPIRCGCAKDRFRETHTVKTRRFRRRQKRLRFGIYCGAEKVLNEPKARCDLPRCSAYVYDAEALDWIDAYSNYRCVNPGQMKTASVAVVAGNIDESEHPR